MTTDTVSRAGLEKAIASRSFLRFLDHVKILEPPQGDSPGGVIPFVMWDHLREMVDLLGDDLLISIIKARQIGLSWLLAAYSLWKALYSFGAVVMMFSQGEKESAVLLGKARFIHSNLPPHLQGVLGTDNTTEMSFPLVHSKMLAFPSTEKAGQGETASLVIQDEADHHDHMDANYAAVKPTVDAGGQLIQVSTVRKNKDGGQRVQKAVLWMACTARQGRGVV